VALCITKSPTCIVLPTFPGTVEDLARHAEQNAQANEGKNKEKNSERIIHQITDFR
jgi:hypothetical protein